MPAAPRLSLAMIVRDEEETLGRILGDAAAFCDELVVVDTGSVDASPQIARDAGARVVPFTWVDDFAAARNAAFEACRGDWIIWLDADDHVTPEVQAGIRELKPTLAEGGVDAVWLQYRYAFDATTGACSYAFNRERIIRRAARLRWQGVVHEVIAVPAGRSLVREDLYVEHRPAPAKAARRGDRNLRILTAAVERGDRSPRTLFYYGRELADHGRFAESFDAFASYLEDPGPSWEQHAALVGMARAARALSRWDEAIRCALGALAVDPARAEGLLAAGLAHYDQQAWADALPFFWAATVVRPPADGFVDLPSYRHLGWDYAGVCLSNLARHDEAIAAFEHALAGGSPDVERLEQNLAWSRSQLAG